MPASPVPTRQQLVDLAWRANWTFIQAFIASITAAGLNVVDINGLEAAFIAGVGAALSVVKTFASNRAGTGTSPTVPTTNSMTSPPQPA